MTVITAAGFDCYENAFGVSSPGDGFGLLVSDSFFGRGRVVSVREV